MKRKINKQPPPKASALASTSLATNKEPIPLYYPVEAVKAGLEGVVLLELLADDTGLLQSVLIKTSSGHAILDQAAVIAATANLQDITFRTPSTVFSVVFKLH